ncbi:MAG: TlpA disulfide reductase family protein [Gemmataceae bacterium]
MPRPLLATIVLSLSSAIACGDEPTKTEPAFVAEFKALQKQALEAQQKLIAESIKAEQAAKTNEEREKLGARSMAEQKKLMAPYCEKAVALVRPNATDPAAVPALVWVLPLSGGSMAGEEAAALLTKHHPVHPDVLMLARRAMTNPHPWVVPLLRTQLVHPDLPKDWRMNTLRGLAGALRTLAEMPGELANTTDTQAEYWATQYGKETVEGWKKIDVAKAEAEAIKAFEELADKHGSEEVIKGLTCGEFARSSVFAIKNLTVGKVAPDIEGEDLDGVKFKLSDYKGKVVVVTFWAKWCGACLVMAPRERELADRMTDRPFVLIGVNGDPEKKGLAEVMAQHKINWRSFWAGEKGPAGPIPTAWNVNQWPTTYLIDHTGVIRAKNAFGTKLDERTEEWVKKAEVAVKK